MLELPLAPDSMPFQAGNPTPPGSPVRAVGPWMPNPQWRRCGYGLCETASRFRPCHKNRHRDHRHDYGGAGLADSGAGCLEPSAFTWRAGMVPGPIGFTSDNGHAPKTGPSIYTAP
jgi:hypothetical protein